MVRVTVSVRVRAQEIPGGEPLASQWSPRKAEWWLHGSLQFRHSLCFKASLPCVPLFIWVSATSSGSSIPEVETK